MKLLNGFDISASALTAQRLRMDIISSNIANADTTRAQRVGNEWVPYQRKMVVMEPRQSEFASMLQTQMNGGGTSAGQGVKVTSITTDSSPFKQVYDPTHPDANEEGYVLMPNVDILKEMVDMMSASRAYEANVTSFNASKSMFMKGLEIGR